MATDRNKFQFVTNCCWLCVVSFIIATTTTTSTTTTTTHAAAAPQSRSAQSAGSTTAQDSTALPAFSPRVDYNNEWRPVGRGDPLKNDPTYDYSPPALERVRYWAESSDKDGQKKEASGSGGSTQTETTLRKPTAAKNEVLLLGVSSERLRGGAPTRPHVYTNAKGETPLVQPKYTSIRRSYYAAGHQLPTRLMPPPMQAAVGSSGVAQHMMKPQVMGDYRHNMMSSMGGGGGGGGGAGGSPATMTMSTHHHHQQQQHQQQQMLSHQHQVQQHKPQHMMTMSSTRPYLTTSTSTTPWLQHGASSTNAMSTHYGHPAASHAPSKYDLHHQESVNYVSYTRPSTGASYSPNAIRPHQNALKQGAASRKPWLHELLQKEVIKPARPTMPATKYLMGTTKPYYAHETMHSAGISTTYPPVSFVTPPATLAQEPRPSLITMYTSSPSFYNTAATTPSSPTAQTTPAPPPPTATLPSYPYYPTPSTTSRTTTTPTTTVAPAPTASRLLIPNTSNLAFRPTVAPLEMTTDSLFKHYNQPDKPLKGPMYLIIEGHSKVKTYGKNDLDPHQPKIVPVISKREPVVRIADPNERRGTVESFQVKHLHTKTTIPTPRVPTTTVPPPTTTTATKPTTTTTTSTTTAKPKPKATTTTKRPTTRMPTTTSRPSTSTKTSTKTSTTTTTTTTERPPRPTEQYLTQPPPSGMQGLLSLLDASFKNIFKAEEAAASTATDPTREPQIYVTTARTVLKPVAGSAAARAPPQLEPRISSKSDRITSLIDEEYEDDAGTTTDPVPREVRQVYDYDSLPESRRKELMAVGLVDDDENAEAWLGAAYDDDDDDDDRIDEEIAEDEADYDDDDSHQLIKRIDKLVDDDDDDDDDDASNFDLDDEDDDNDDDADDDAEERSHAAPSVATTKLTKV